MNETQIIRYLRKIIQVGNWDTLKEGTISDWENWLDSTKLRDKSLNQFIKLLIKLEILIESDTNQNKYRLHDESWIIARDYLENNIEVFQELILLYDIKRSKKKLTE